MNDLGKKSRTKKKKKATEKLNNPGLPEENPLGEGQLFSARGKS